MEKHYLRAPFRKAGYTMASLDQYIIPYLGLRNGEHRFAYTLDTEFFSHFETSKIKKAQLDVVVLFDRRDHIVTLDITASGHFDAPCDRCMTDISIPMTFDDQVIIKMEETIDDGTDVVVYLDPKTSMIDISPYIYECVHVHLPIQNLKDCEAEEYNDCDMQILDRLNYIDDEQEEDQEEDKGIWKDLENLNLN